MSVSNSPDLCIFWSFHSQIGEVDLTLTYWTFIQILNLSSIVEEYDTNVMMI